MRKFFAFTLAAAVATIGATALTLNDKGAKNLKVSNAPTSELQQLRKASASQVQNALPLEFNGVKADTSKKAPRKAGGSVNLIEGDWTASYNGMLSNNSGAHECDVTIEWIDAYEQLEISFADFSMPFYADYEEATGKLTFNLEILTQSGAMYVAQWPMIGSTVQNAVTATFDSASKTIEFDNANAALAFAALSDMSTSALEGYYWAINRIELSQPDGDYSLKVEFDEECTPDNKFTYSISAGTDVAEVYVVGLEGDNSASEYSDYFGPTIGKDYGVKAEAGSYSIDLSQEGAMEDGTGYFTVMAYAYDAAGNLVKKTQDCVFVTVNEDADYQKIGTIEFNDALVNGYYNNFTNDKEAVEIQENINTPGLYRLVEAYSGQSANHNSECAHYIYIDAQDPTFVNIPTSSTGLDFGDGMLVIGTFGGALGYTKSQCMLNGYAVGSLSERTITFPARSVLAHEKRYNEPGSWSYMNSGSIMTIELPELKLNVTAKDTKEAAVSGAEVSVSLPNSDDVLVSGTTGEDGTVVLTLPASVDYLASVVVTVKNGEDSDVKTVKLNGADNDHAVVFEAASEPTGDTITGTITNQLDMNQGMLEETDLLDPETWDVTATYNADTKELTISHMFQDDDEYYPIVFTVDPSTGTAVAESQVCFKYEDNGVVYEETYYRGLSEEDGSITAVIYNTEEGKCVLEVSPWGEAVDYSEYGMGWFFSFAYYNTVITLDTTIEGLGSQVDAPSVKIGDVTYKPEMSGSEEFQALIVTLTIPVETENLGDNEVRVAAEYTYKSSAEDETANIANGDNVVISTEKDVDGNYLIVLGGLQHNSKYDVVITASATVNGVVVSDTEEIEINTTLAAVEGISVEKADAVYYDLNGNKVVNPDKGIYIKVTEGKAVKVVK